MALRTIDGGATWTPQGPITSAFIGHDIQFIDSEHGWIAGDELVATIDGGETWHAVDTPAPGPIKRVWFTDASSGWIESYGLHHTTDGGATWTTVDWPGCCNPIGFADVQRGWITAHTNTTWEIRHTTNGGTTWTTQLSGPRPAWLWRMTVVDPQTVWIVGNSCDAFDCERMLVTRDGGQTWQELPPSANNTFLHDLQFIDTQRGWAVGWAGSILHTEDGGQTWTVQEAAAWHWTDDGSQDPDKMSLLDVHFTDAQHGWAVGAGFGFLKTTTGGK